jgi:hypothetical protein
MQSIFNPQEVYCESIILVGQDCRRHTKRGGKAVPSASKYALLILDPSRLSQLRVLYPAFRRPSVVIIRSLLSIIRWEASILCVSPNLLRASPRARVFSLVRCPLLHLYSGCQGSSSFPTSTNH